MATAKEFSFEVVREIGVLSTSKSGWNREINIVSWNGGKPKIDIRDWAPDHSKMGKGCSLTAEEVAILKEILDEHDPYELVGEA
ncbi:MAG: hypothetical protein EOM03_10045 [Clostridia bacterium]|nr:hypothetical protein [Clostridia bacterium]NLF20375.1 hypothetical protein [Clostridiaceae bacterium]